MAWDKPLEDQIIDQSGHFLWSFVALAPVLLHANWLTGAISGVLLALPRELIDQGVLSKRGSDWLLDVLFFALGGAAAGALF